MAVSSGSHVIFLPIEPLITGLSLEGKPVQNLAMLEKEKARRGRRSDGPDFVRCGRRCTAVLSRAREEVGR